MDLCQYKYALGYPGVGAHAHVGGIAVLDVALTAGIAYAASRYVEISFMYMFVLLMIIALVLHWIFCVPTTLTVALGLVSQLNS